MRGGENEGGRERWREGGGDWRSAALKPEGLFRKYGPGHSHESQPRFGVIFSRASAGDLSDCSRSPPAQTHS